MSAVSETIVREYFEMLGFLVRQQRKFIPRAKQEEAEIDFVVLNPQAEPSNGPLPAILTSVELRAVQQAIVVVKGWHTESFTPAVMAQKPQIFRFLDSKVLQRAARSYGGGQSLTKLLVVPSLPQQDPGRQQAVDYLRQKGIDAVIPFGTMLAELIDRVEVNHNYQKSDLLQTLRILKNYEFFREPQMELFKPGRRRKSSAGS